MTQGQRITNFLFGFAHSWSAILFFKLVNHSPVAEWQFKVGLVIYGILGLIDLGAVIFKK